jgi:hypothetical protein
MENKSQIDLTNIVAPILKGNKFDLSKNPNSESFFTPTNNSFYGFCIPMHVFADYITGHDNAIDTVDIPHEDLTNQKLIDNGKA